MKISPFVFISSGGGKQPPNHHASKISSNGGGLWHMPPHIFSQKNYSQLGGGNQRLRKKSEGEMISAIVINSTVS